MITTILTRIDDIMYTPILLIILISAAVFLSIRMKFPQVRLFGNAWTVILQKPEEEGAVSSFQALMISTASRVGTGNIIGVSTALCMGGPGAVFWMFLMAVLGGASAFTETVAAQIYKERDEDGVGCHGGPAYYIRDALHNKFFAGAFTIFLMLTYGVGFNLLCSYNVQSTFATYSFYDAKLTPLIVGIVLAVLTGLCLFGGGKMIAKVTEFLVPFMGIVYVAVSVIVVLMHITYLPALLGLIFKDAFNFRAIFGGIGGSCLMYGIKRGLFSNEAGVGSAPNAAASADVSHPVQQGLVAVVSVCIDTIFICSATAFMCLSSGIPTTHELAGAPYVQAAMQKTLGAFGPIFITVAMVLFAFTTLLGNLYYCEIGLKFLNKGRVPGKVFMAIFNIVCCLVIFVGALMQMDAVWAAADITMGLMVFINIPAILILHPQCKRCLDNYVVQLKAGNKDPRFYAADIGLDDSDLDYWKREPGQAAVAAAAAAPAPAPAARTVAEESASGSGKRHSRHNLP